MTLNQNSDSHQQLIDPNTNQLCVSGTESTIINTYYANVGSNILRNQVGIEPWDVGTVRRLTVDGIAFDDIDARELEFVLKNIEIGKWYGLY